MQFLYNDIYGHDNTCAVHFQDIFLIYLHKYFYANFKKYALK